jgi:hypothetical protein
MDFHRKKRYVGMIVGGHDGDPDPQQTSNQRVKVFGIHGPDVKKGDLAFSYMQHSPTQMSQQSFGGAMDPGTLVWVEKVPGENQVTIVGQANDLYGKEGGGQGGSSGGGQSLIEGDFMDAIKTELNIFVPPEIKEKTVKEATVKVPKEKGKKHKHELMQGMPTHAALFPMSGYRLPQVKKVPTAKQSYQNLPTKDLLGKLPGDLGSLSGLMKGLMGGMGKGGGGGGGGGQGGAAGQGSSTNSQAGQGSSSSSSETKNNNPLETETTDTNSVTTQEGNATTTVETVKKTKNKVSSTHYDIHDPNSYRFGRAYDRYLAIHAKTPKESLPSRVTLDTSVSFLEDEQVDYTGNETTSEEITTTNTEQTYQSANTKIENFTGTYSEYFGANSNVTRMDVIFHNVEPQVAIALDNLSVLLQGDAEGDGHSLTAGRVHMETWLDNATDLFCQCKSVTDIMDSLHRITHDESLFGHDQIEAAIIEVETAYGMANTVIHANGDFAVVYSDDQLAEMANTEASMLSWEFSPSSAGMNANTGNAKIEYANSKTSNAGSGGGGGGGGGGAGAMGALSQLGNMFGKSAPTMLNMFKRMNKDHDKESKELHKKLNESEDAKNLWKHVEKTHEGGNPVDFELFKKLTGGGGML